MKMMKPLNKQLTIKIRHYLLAFPVECPECKKENIIMANIIQKLGRGKTDQMMCSECARKMFFKLLLETTPESNK